MDTALREYFTIIRNAAARHMANAKVQVHSIVRTYPAYLCSDEQSRDFDKYIKHYDKLTH